ncbi:MAG: hypothetical protein U1E53_11005 [Dongiaceae bacterium]
MDGGVLAPGGAIAAADRSERLAALRDGMRRLERGAAADRAGVLPLGCPALDAALGGGLALGGLHELGGDVAGEAAAAGFAALLLGRLVAARGRPVLWCGAVETLHPPGLAGLGLPPERVVLLRAGRPADRLWAMEEGLRSPALAGVLGELPELGLTDSRRLQLAAEAGGGLGRVLRQGGRRRAGSAAERPSAALTRWRVASAPSGPPPLPPGTTVPRWGVPLDPGSPARLLGPPRWRLADALPWRAPRRLAGGVGRCDGSFRCGCRTSRRSGSGGPRLTRRPGRSPPSAPLPTAACWSRSTRRRRPAASAPARRWPMRGRCCRSSPCCPPIRRAEAATLGRLADWCDRYTPLVGIEAEDGGAGAGLWLDVTGCSHLLGGEAELLGDLVARLGRLGHAARAGLADTPGAAWAAARFLAHCSVVPPGGAREALAPLPVAALRLMPAATAGLERLGLRRVADLLPLPRAALARRFGSVVGARLDQGPGRAAGPISPRPAPPFAERLAFAEPIGEAASLAAALARLLERLCRRLDAAQQGARRLALTLYRVDGSRQDLAIGTSRPSRDPAPLGRLFAEALGRVDPGFGIELMALAATRAEPLTALQIALARAPAASSAPGAAPPADADGLAALIDRLGNRLGFTALGCPTPRRSHWPERAFALAAAPEEPAAWPATPPRPLRLLPRPEPVEAEPAAPARPPAWFARQGRRHRVAAAEGPERIAPEWWREDGGAARDYYRLEDDDGGRFWLYREDAPGDGRDDRWYLHGLFA